MKPLLILVSGAPGSGKTTLAGSLARHMKFLHIERDRVFDSMRQTFEPNQFDREKDGIPLFYELLVSVLKAQTNIIVDATLYRGKSEADILPLHQFCTLINIHCRAKNEHQRFYDREIAKANGVPEWLPLHMPRLEQIYDLVSEPLDLGCPTIEVSTTRDYRPSLQKIAATIKKQRR